MESYTIYSCIHNKSPWINILPDAHRTNIFDHPHHNRIVRQHFPFHHTQEEMSQGYNSVEKVGDTEVTDNDEKRIQFPTEFVCEKPELKRIDKNYDDSNNKRDKE